MKFPQFPFLKKIQSSPHFHKLLFSSQPKWNSNQNPNLVITHPTLILIESCNSMSQLKQIQAKMIHTGISSHIFPISRLISFCALDINGDIHYANALFSEVLEPNVYIWNTMIRGYVKNQLFEKGFCFFRRMVRESVEMDKRSYVFVLKGCSVLEGVGGSVHCRIWKVGFFNDLIVRNGLIHFYGESGKVVDAQKVFDESPVRDVVTWTSLIDGYVKRNMVDEALGLFELMCSNGVEFNDVTMITVFSACSLKGDLSLGKSVHELVEKRGVKCSLNLMNAVLDMYVKCGCLPMAKEIFDKMEIKDVFSWTSMIHGYAKNGEVDMAKKCFSDMLERNIVSWTAMIACYSQNNRPWEALELFHEMEKQGLVPIESTLVSVLSACAQSGSLDFARRIHDYYIKQKRVKYSVILANALIDMYGKCGSMDVARDLFHEMPERDLVSWNSVIVGCASHGLAEKALNLFEQMKCTGFKPDSITFVGVLSACAHGGLVNQGWEYFRSMELNGLLAEVIHYACMVDLLSRSGHLKEAYNLIKQMPMEPDKAVWGALLNGCRMHGNVELAKVAAEKLIELDPQDSGIYVLLASLCADERKWADVRMVRTLMRAKGVKKNPGYSLMEVDGNFYEFVVADDSHPQSRAIYRMLDEIMLLSKLEEYVSDAQPADEFS
ncbi:pentatricopeptide repeat-containing protein At2g22410, mitochondrial-like [Nicotiana tabacum]|uniref:Pentatricopeptide repeat-containing protein At2g22410, mitochondrial-like n=3 Tax=Nicotiana TaxID=4085 RepID=A0AC58UIX2_TOBAC|nr:PREDICTED: pentatricopeptide repeat-containing protein At2g22410, mitochondrial-like [Nicotiana sylvestris]